MQRTVKTAFLVALFTLLATPALSAEVKITASGVGFVSGGDVASARDRAIRDAQVRALEKALGVAVDARVALHKSLLIDDTVLTRTTGMIRDYRILKETRVSNGLYRVTIEAHVDRVVMADELVRMAGEKRVLLARGGQDAGGDHGDRMLLAALAEAYSSAGFKVSETVLPDADFRMSDGETIRKLAEKTGNNLVVRLQLDSSEPQCLVNNFCACRSDGFLRLYEGKGGSQLVFEEIKDVRGFGNTPPLAREDALKKGAMALVNGMMGQLFFPRERDLRVAVRNIPDHQEYRSLLRTLKMFRWVTGVQADSVGYHPVKSIFIVRFIQDLSLFSGMLGKLGGYRFEGRQGKVFTLMAER